MDFLSIIDIFINWITFFLFLDCYVSWIVLTILSIESLNCRKVTYLILTS